MDDGKRVHEAYRRMLETREVRRVAARFGLDRNVRYEFVDERRSFHGKAGTVDGEGLVRLPSNARPEPFLLLTLLHEWAHLLAQRQKHPRRQNPHGSDWRRFYASLVRSAVRERLFPGNEQEVTRHAAAGEARTYLARLCDPEGQPLLPHPERAAAQFDVGEAVQFVDGQGRVVAGTVRRLNARTYTVAAGDGARVYRVPIGYKTLARAGEPLPAPASPWRVGMRVQFTDAAGQVIGATVTRVNRRTLTLAADNGIGYRVGYGHPALRPEA